MPSLIDTVHANVEHGTSQRLFRGTVAWVLAVNKTQMLNLREKHESKHSLFASYSPKFLDYNFPSHWKYYLLFTILRLQLSKSKGPFSKEV